MAAKDWHTQFHYLLRRSFAGRGIKLGRDGLFDVLREASLLVPTKRTYHKTTNNHRRFHEHPSLLNGRPDKVIVNRPEEILLADITYVPPHKKLIYLSLVTGAYFRRIMRYHVHGSLQIEEASMALKMAIKGQKTHARLIHHSDRVIQYCSSIYQRPHEKQEIKCSITDGYDCYQNPRIMNVLIWR